MKRHSKYFPIFLIALGFSACQMPSLINGTTKTAADTTKTAADTTKTAADTTKTAADTTKTAADTTKTAADTTKTAADTTKTAADTTKTAAKPLNFQDGKKFKDYFDNNIYKNLSYWGDKQKEYLVENYFLKPNDKIEFDYIHDISKLKNTTEIYYREVTGEGFHNLAQDAIADKTLFKIEKAGTKITVTAHKQSYDKSYQDAQLWFLSNEGNWHLITLQGMTEQVIKSDKKNKFVDEEIDKLIKTDKFTKAKSDFEKIKATHDWVIDQAEFGRKIGEGYDSQIAYGVFQNHLAVCEGYARAVRRILTKLGITCEVKIGPATSGTETVRHAWNLVKIEEKWYHLDATWDDQTKNNPIRYDYFLRSDAFMKNSRTWDGNHKANADYPLASGNYHHTRPRN